MFSGAFQESHELMPNGQLEISLPDDDSDALMILLDIMHGLTRRVPRRVDCSTLLNVAILADKYGLHKSVELFADLWINHLADPIPKRHAVEDIPKWRTLAPEKGNRCHPDCDLKAIGMLTKDFAYLDLINPPDPPYDGFSVAQLTKDYEGLAFWGFNCPRPLRRNQVVAKSIVKVFRTSSKAKGINMSTT
ncbi:hypothetical protein AJ79_05435 [Helicocarpus griseus UAMH5409]|uniref:BTB domain-containing protein n=1 Tax=Helicocarpus griseus UAMH5409 TaxID=1447875 RepID=A0A2B7XPQ9_9EURO|nr:hypothetical protein AJ79_05435 [Helicocarpus griseus UAMH5409]